MGSNYKNNSEKFNPNMSDSFFNGQATTWWTRHQTFEELQSTTSFQRSSQQGNLLNNKNGGRTDVEEVQNSTVLMKMKALDSDCGLDLNLSLKAPNKLDEFDQKGNSDNNGDDGVVSSLSLSLSSSPTSKLGRFKEGDGDTKHSRPTTTSTLDLTL